MVTKTIPKRRVDEKHSNQEAVELQVPQETKETLETVLSQSKSLILKATDFEVGETLGEGSFYDVYSAEYTGKDETVPTEVAFRSLKSTAKKWSDKAISNAKFFLEEAEILQEINHPAFPKIYGITSTTDTLGKVQQHMILEKIGGAPLTRTLNSGYSLEDIGSLGEQLFEALGHLHSLGKIHRDIKPENLHVEDDNILRILDLGCVTDRHEATWAKTAAMGTLKYAAPDLMAGEAYARSDVYSSGLVLYEMFMEESIDKFEMGKTHNTLDFIELKNKLILKSGNETFSDGICDLIKDMTKGDAKARIQTVDVANDRLKSVYDSLIDTKPLELENNPETSQDSNKELPELNPLFFIELNYEVLKIMGETKLLKKDVSILKGYLDLTYEIQKDLKNHPKLERLFSEVGKYEIELGKSERKKTKLATSGFGTYALGAIGIGANFLINHYDPSYTPSPYLSDLSLLGQMSIGLMGLSTVLHVSSIFPRSKSKKIRQKLNVAQKRFEYHLFNAPNIEGLEEFNRQRLVDHLNTQVEDKNSDYNVEMKKESYSVNYIIKSRKNPEKQISISICEWGYFTLFHPYEENQGSRFDSIRNDDRFQSLVKKNDLLKKFRDSGHNFYFALEHCIKYGK